jgi:hypothetical protein
MRFSMAKKKTSRNTEQSNPENNKGMAIRRVLKKTPGAKAADVVDAVKKQYGHDVGKNRVYMVKTRGNMSTDGRASKPNKGDVNGPLTSAALWIDAINLAQQLLKSTGSLDNATALLKALADN